MMDIYNLINSKAISQHCKKIKHQFNIEEIAILIYRSKQISIEEKIKYYNQLITEYADMPMIKHLHCGPYDSIKEVIKTEISRIEEVYSKIQNQEEEYFYYANCYYKSSGMMEWDNVNTVRKIYNEVLEIVNNIIEEDNDIAEFRIVKKSYTMDYKITAEFFVKDKQVILTNIYDSNNEYPDMGTIFLNIPTPFKRGDLLCSNSNHPFDSGYIHCSNNVFVLKSMKTWEENLEQRLQKGCYDDSDMLGYCYYINDEDIMFETCYDYDCWEYYKQELTDMEKILKGVSNLLQGNIELDLFIQAYNKIKRNTNMHEHLNYFTDEGLKLAGLNETDIEKIKNK